MHYDAHQPVIDDLEARILTIRDSLDYDTKVERRDGLQNEMNAADFWNDQEAAKKVIDEYKLLKAQTDGLEKVIGSFEDAQVGL